VQQQHRLSCIPQPACWSKADQLQQQQLALVTEL
jgi:hypothetical protein